MGDLQTFLAAPRRFVQVGATKVAYRKFGQGPAVVFVHGWPVAGASYRGLIAAMRPRFTCYVPDLPGAGDTPWDPAIKEFFVDQSRVVEAFADALGLSRYALVGFDSGGAMARLVAARRPDCVTALALTNTEVPGHIAPLVRQVQLAMAVPGASWIFTTLLKSRAYRRSRFGFGALFSNKDLLDGEFHQATVVPLLATVDGARAGLRCADLTIANRLGAVHAQITAPVLLVWGQDDPFFPVRLAKATLDTFAGPARLVTIPDTKLFVHIEAPVQVAAAMTPFLEMHCDPETISPRGAPNRH